MQIPTPPPSYLQFMLEQARILGRKAERSGLCERARHYRQLEDSILLRLAKPTEPREATTPAPQPG